MTGCFYSKKDKKEMMILKSWENNGKRIIQKRFDLSQLEADLLHGKAVFCGMSEAQYLRELICASQPTEAPPREFYLACNDINKIGVNINQIAKMANISGIVSQEDIEYIRSVAVEIAKNLFEIKKTVSTPRYYSASYFDQYAHACKQARKEGRPIPDPGDDIISREYEKSYPDHPEKLYRANLYEDDINEGFVMSGQTEADIPDASEEPEETEGKEGTEETGIPGMEE